MLDEKSLPYPAPAAATVYPNWAYSPRMDYGVITFEDGRTVCVQGDDAHTMDDAVEYAANLDPSLVVRVLEPFSEVATHE